MFLKTQDPGGASKIPPRAEMLNDCNQTKFQINSEWANRKRSSLCSVREVVEIKLKLKMISEHCDWCRTNNKPQVVSHRSMGH